MSLVGSGSTIHIWPRSKKWKSNKKNSRLINYRSTVRLTCKGHLTASCHIAGRCNHKKAGLPDTASDHQIPVHWERELSYPPNATPLLTCCWSFKTYSVSVKLFGMSDLFVIFKSKKNDHKESDHKNKKETSAPIINFKTIISNLWAMPDLYLGQCVNQATEA